MNVILEHAKIKTIRILNHHGTGQRWPSALDIRALVYSTAQRVVDSSLTPGTTVLYL